MLNYILTILIVITASQKAIAKQGSKPSFSLHTGAGLSTHKSKTVVSNDTATTSFYAMKFQAGSDNSVGVSYQSNSTTADFELNNSSIVTIFNDTVFSYNWWYISVGLVISNSDITVTSNGTELFSGIGTGYGASFAGFIPVGKKSKVVFFFDSISYSTFKHDASDEISIGAKTDIKVYSISPLTKKLLNLEVGFNSESYSMSVNGTSTAETVYTPWLGLSVGFEL